jgi:hypothetical protein
MSSSLTLPPLKSGEEAWQYPGRDPERHRDVSFSLDDTRASRDFLASVESLDLDLNQIAAAGLRALVGRLAHDLLFVPLRGRTITVLETSFYNVYLVH